jgi:hypothetical protein
VHLGGQSHRPGGRRLFTTAFRRRAPYFASAHVDVQAMAPHYGEVTVPPGMRWLRQGMEVEYVAQADTEVTCIAESTTADWDGVPDVLVTVTATTAGGTVAVCGTIRLWVTPVQTDSSALTRARQ